MGIQLSMDDYGTGSSSASLRDLPVTELKIDQSIVADLADDHDDAVMVQGATDLGHGLGLSVVAEGVEDEMTLTTLKSIGVDVVQGYLLGHPMPQEQLERWILDRPDILTDSP